MSFKLDKNRIRGARTHRTFVSIVQRFICTKGVRPSKRMFEKSRNPCWDKSCRLQGSSEQLLTCNPYDVEFNLVTEGSQLTYLYQQFQVPSASTFKGKGTRHAVGETKDSCIFMIRTHHHLQTTKKNACLAQQDVVSEFPFLTDDNTPISFLEGSELNFRKISDLGPH